MTVIRTDNWLEKAYHSPKRIFKKLTAYFDNATEYEIAELLTMHGMYYKPEPNEDSLIKAFREKNVWKIIQQEEYELKQQWDGKNIPIFILPSNTYNRKIMDHYNGKSGLSYPDKLFLFISEENTKEELKALFTHEYNHCCRLAHNPRKEEDYCLLDIIILEGLAEQAVEERYGKKLLAPWTSYYDDKKLEHIWKTIIEPNKDLPKANPRTFDLLYGKKSNPDMAGYCVGYFLVNQYAQKTGKKSRDLLSIPSEKIAST